MISETDLIGIEFDKFDIASLKRKMTDLEILLPRLIVTITKQQEEMERLSARLDKLESGREPGNI